MTGASGHAQHLLPMIDELLSSANLIKTDLEAIVFDQGPGAFTGLRLACGIAQGMGLALNLPLIPIGALAAVAASAQLACGSLVVPALDARMDEIYLAVYLVDEDQDVIQIQPPILVPARDLPRLVSERKDLWMRHAATLAGNVNADIACLGEGYSLLDETEKDMLTQLGLTLINQVELPHACWLAALGEKQLRRGNTIIPEHAAPLYLRDKVAFTTIERQAGEGGNPKVAALGGTSLLAMTEADLDDVYDIERSVQSFPWSRKNFEDALAAGYEAWVLREHQRIVGFCIAMVAPDVTHILVIAVAKNAQRKGYATQLLEHVSRSARARSADGLLLEVRPSNRAARIFYESYGFEQIGLRRDYYPSARDQREDALVLKKTFLGA